MDAAEIGDVVAPVTGTYLVLVASFDSGFNGTGTYRLSMAKTPGPITVSDGDQGGPLSNGGIHTGELVRGDLDTWTFTANAGERIALHIGEITDNDDFRPWIRIWAPNGASLGSSGGWMQPRSAMSSHQLQVPIWSSSPASIADSTVPAPTVSRWPKRRDRLQFPMAIRAGHSRTAESIPVRLFRGDLDVWTFTANVGERIALHIGEITDN